MMEIANVSFPEVFILLGFSERPSLEPILFIFVLGIYVVTVLGNGVIIVVPIAWLALLLKVYNWHT